MPGGGHKDHFERVMHESETEMRLAGGEQLPKSGSEASLSYQILVKSLACPNLEKNVAFQ